MNFKSYPIYKGSGVEWLGEVPEHWGVKRLGLHFCQRSEKVSDRDYPPLSVTKNGIVPQLESAAKTNDGDNRKLVLSGDYVINSRSDRKGSSGVSTLDGSVSLINIVLKPYLKLISPNFSHFLLRSYLFQEEFYKYGHGIVADLWTTNYSDMKNIYLAIPPLYEQTQIASFLDSETSRIDNLIAKQEKLIEKLEEHRKSVISHAVTKGLDPNVPMKDSGVQWLGEVPESWLISRLKFYSNLNMGQSPDSSSYHLEEGIPFLQGNAEFGEFHPTHKLFCKDPKKISKINDILFSVRAPVGDVNISNIEYCIGRGLCAITPNKLNSAYSIYALDVVKRFLGSVSKGTTFEGVTLENLENSPLLVPSICEQTQIVSFLDSETSRIDNLIAKQEKLIEKLKEYRTSIISHAVTGKIDVRDLVA